MTLIDPQEVHKTFINCQFAFKEGKDEYDVIHVVGIMHNANLSKAKLEIHRAQITDWLNDLPPEFHKIGTRKGAQDGWSFLNLCTDRHGNLWTGMHATCEELMLLAMGLDMMKYLLPRDLWEVCPGGMPYLQVDTTV